MDRVVVIGGGIVGAAAAYRVVSAETGTAVTLVDRGHPGRATDVGAGIVAPAVSRIPPGPWYGLAAAAVAAYPDLVTRLSDDGERDTGYETVGGLFVATDDDEADRLDEVRAMVEARARDGMGNVGEVSVLEPGDAHRLFPPLAPGTHAVHLSDGARVDGRRLRRALVRATERRGADVRRGRAVIRIERGTARGVDVDGEPIPADAVIVASGAWAPDATEPLAAPWPVVPQRGQIAHLDVPGEPTGRWPFVVGFHSHYLLTFPDHRVVAGASREDDAGFDPRVTAGGVHEILGEALRVAPGLAEAALVGVRVGIRPMSPDGLPLLGPFGADGLFLANGLGPSGLMMGAFAGAAVADLVLGRGASMDLAPVDPRRFPNGIPAP